MRRLALRSSTEERLQYHLFLDTISMHIQKAPASCVPFFACMHVCAVSLGVLIRDCSFDLCEPGDVIKFLITQHNVLNMELHAN